MSGEPALMSLVSVAKAIAAKQVSSREVTQSCLDRIGKWQPKLNAFMAIEAEDALKRPTPPMRRWRRAAAAACCTACRWRTRTCTTTRASS